MRGSDHGRRVDPEGPVRSSNPLVRKREVSLFLFIGAGVAVCGHLLLELLIRSGFPAGLANAVQIVVTLQLSFVAHDVVTWRRPSLGRRASWACRWWRFQVARGASAVLSLVAFPFLWPVIGTSGVLGTAGGGRGRELLHGPVLVVHASQGGVGT
jgi:putative flippase GtrA